MEYAGKAESLEELDNSSRPPLRRLRSCAGPGWEPPRSSPPGQFVSASAAGAETNFFSLTAWVSMP
jgi:hypothetical protein